ncbi:MAG: hypothetical protein O2798_05765 [Chloroflexi bacterium]|nr:hypothetical protein [Chloroflexota bacterium]MDA1240337.1 hypothetical protein [Chloroflexota bacterium]
MTSAKSLQGLEQSLLRRVLASGDGRRLHLRFRPEVVDRYREQAGAQIIRTRTVGRIAFANRWSLDVGIAEVEGGEMVLHATLGDLLERLPEEERDHWIAHLWLDPASENFLQMKMVAAACIDDGEPVAWT